MLTFMTLGVEVSKSLPTVPYIRSNDLWFFGCTAFIFCSLAEFAFVNTLWRYGYVDSSALLLSNPKWEYIRGIPANLYIHIASKI